MKITFNHIKNKIKMKLVKKLGLWMDNSIAHIIEFVL